MIFTKSPATSRAAPAQPALAATLTPDAERLQAQFAALAEAGGLGDMQPLLQLLRALLRARTLAFLGAAEVRGFEDVTVGAASGLGKLRPTFDREKAMVQPAIALGSAGYTLAVPVWREGALCGWLATQLVVANPRDVQAFVVLLQTAAGYLLYREERRSGGEMLAVLERTSGLLDLLRRAGAEPDFDLACRQALEKLREYVGCDRIFLGLRRRGAVRLVAITGTTRIDPKSPSHQPFEAALLEALHGGPPVDFTPATPRTEATVAHELLQMKTGAARLFTLPLPHGRGALLLEWKTPPDPAAQSVATAAAPFVPVLFALLDRARPHPVLFAVQRLWQKAGRPQRRAGLLGIGAGLLLLAWPFHYRIGADCRLSPTVKRVVAAPFDGQLRRSLVRPGDAVRAGDPLGVLDNRELKLKEAELTATRERALKQRDRAMSGDTADFAAGQVANFEAQSIGEELALVRRKLELLEVKAPIAGVVVSGDLHRSEGQPVPRGQVLWEVAPLDSMVVEIDVPDREVSRIQSGQPVAVRLEAFGSGHWTTTLQRVHPQSEQREGRNVFIAEADLVSSGLGTELRPGMRGRASIESARRPLVWILGHRLWDWLVTTLLW